MSTRSDIIALGADGKWRRIYCHHDGYLEGVGLTLYNNYREQTKIDTLMALGDLSSLGAEIGGKHDFGKDAGDTCTAYGRDRDETDIEAKVGDTLQAVWPEEGTWTEYTYVWDGARWRVGDPDEGSQTLFDLGEVLLGSVKLRPLIKAPLGVIGQHSGAIDQTQIAANGGVKE